jgi:ATP-dependent Clp protease ATP-binding subunit ClpC
VVKALFERFTERARSVVIFAQEEARTLKHGYIGTEHILLGLLREEEGVAARVLDSLDLTFERVRTQIVRIVGSGEEVTSGHVPFTPRAKRVLELALREALSLGHNYIGTEHILLGLVREYEGVAARVLLDFGVDAETVRSAVLEQLTPKAQEQSSLLPNPLRELLEALEHWVERLPDQEGLDPEDTRKLRGHLARFHKLAHKAGLL